MRKLLARFANDESGATAIEYGLIAAGISVAIITVVGTLGTKPEHHVYQRPDSPQVTCTKKITSKAPPLNGTRRAIQIWAVRAHVR